MYAFGDMVVFLGAFALASLPATGAALFFLRGKPWFWTVLAPIAVGVAMTGVVWVLACHFVPYNGAHGLIRTFSLLFPLRVLAAPMFAMVFLLSALMAPARRLRNAMFLATAAEALIFLATSFRWVLGLHF